MKPFRRMTRCLPACPSRGKSSPALWCHGPHHGSCQAHHAPGARRQWLRRSRVRLSINFDGAPALELNATATLYSDNDDFYGGNTRSQDPVYSTQVHAIDSTHSGLWASLDAT